jgi:hypothetical protein
MHMNKIIVNIITIAVIASVLAFAGCVGKESTAPTTTPSPTSTPKQMVSIPTITPTPSPTAIPTPIETVNVTLKAGYKWYQDTDFSYRIGYPENWTTNPPGILNVTVNNESGWTNTVGFVSPSLISLIPNGPRIPEATIMVTVSQNQDLVATNWSEYGGLDALKAKGIVSKYGNITINGREGFEVIYDDGMLLFGRPAGNIRMIGFEANGLYYQISVMASNPEGGLYDKYQSTFNDAINSFVIEK